MLVRKDSLFVEDSILLKNSLDYGNPDKDVINLDELLPFVPNYIDLYDNNQNLPINLDDPYETIRQMLVLQSGIIKEYIAFVKFKVLNFDSSILPTEILQVYNNISTDRPICEYLSYNNCYRLINRVSIRDPKRCLYLASINNCTEIIYYLHQFVSERDEYLTVSSNACKFGNVELVQWLIRHDLFFPYTFLEALKYNRLDLLKSLLPFSKEFKDHLNFYYPIDNDNHEMIQLLLDNDIRFNECDLLIACIKGNLRVVKLILSKSQLVSYVENLRCTTFHSSSEANRIIINTKYIDYACVSGNCELIEYLFENKFDCTYRAVDNACLHNHLNLLRMLIYKGKVGSSMALTNAVKNNNIEIIKLLIVNGCFKSKDALDAAAKKGNLEVFKLLVDQNLKPNMYTLRYAVEENRIDMVKYILEKNIDLYDDQLLNLAVIKGYDEIFDIFIRLAKELSNTLADDAAIHNRLNILQRLLNEYGLNCTGNVLNYVVRNGHISILKYLYPLGYRCDDSSLERAIVEGHTEVVTYLLNYKLDYTFDLLKVAITNNRLEIVKLLITKYNFQCPIEYLTIAYNRGFNDIVRYLCTNPIFY